MSINLFFSFGRRGVHRVGFMLRLCIVLMLFVDFVDLWMTLAEFLGIIVVFSLSHRFGWVLFLTAAFAFLIHQLQFMPFSSCASSSAGTQTETSPSSGTTPIRLRHAEDACGSLSGSSKVSPKSLDSEVQAPPADAVALSGLAALRLHHKQEQALVMRVLLGLDHKCCGCSEFNFSGTNQTHIRVKCSRCSRVCLRLRREAHATVA